jgi:hypothetical protein
MNGAADSFLGMSLDIFPTLDCRVLGWTLYACVAMVQISGLLRVPGSKWADVFIPDLKANYYLNAVIHKLDAMSRLDANASSQEYLRAFQRLKEWYHCRDSGSTIPGLIGEIRDGLVEPALHVRAAGLSMPDAAFSGGMNLSPAEQWQTQAHLQATFDMIPGGSRSEENN